MGRRPGERACPKLQKEPVAFRVQMGPNQSSCPGTGDSRAGDLA